MELDKLKIVGKVYSCDSEPLGFTERVSVYRTFDDPTPSDSSRREGGPRTAHDDVGGHTVVCGTGGESGRPSRAPADVFVGPL